MQETDPDSQAEPTPQTIQQEQSHQNTEGTEDETHSKQEEQPVQVPDVMPNIAAPQGRRGVRSRGRTPGWGSAPRRGMGRGCARRPSGLQTDLLAGQYVPNFIWNDTESDGDYKPINIPFPGVEGLREEMPLDAEPIEYFSKYFTDEVIDIICKETVMLNNILSQCS